MAVGHQQEGREYQYTEALDNMQSNMSTWINKAYEM